MVVANVELLRCWVADFSLRPLGLAAVTLDIFIFTTSRQASSRLTAVKPDDDRTGRPGTDR